MSKKQGDDQTTGAQRAETFDLHSFGERQRDNIVAAEKRAAGTVNVTHQLPVLVIALVVVLVSLFLPHSGSVRGFDVLFDSSLAQRMDTTWIEHIYIWVALIGGVLLPVGTIVSKSSLVAWFNWFFSGLGWIFGFFSIWVRQTRPMTSSGQGPSYGVILATIALVILFVTLCTVVFRRTHLQTILAQIRREEADKDDAARIAQQRLRTGIDMSERRYEIVDDRRARAKQRARQAAEHAEKGAQDAGEGPETSV